MANFTLTVPNKNGSYDGDYVVKQYTSLTISAGNVLTTDQPCKGLLIYVTGNCTIAGTLSMRGRGPASNPDTYLGANGIRYPVLVSGATGTLAAAEFSGAGSAVAAAVANQFPASGNGRIIQIPKRGSSGGAAVGVNGTSGSGTGTTGTAGSASLSSNTYTVTLGGGGAGGYYIDTNSCGGQSTCFSTRGGNATAFSGGTGGGGKMSGTNSASASSPGDDNGGAGGNSSNGHCGGVHTVTGGVGNPGGIDRYGSTGQGGNNQNAATATSGTGGVVWLIVGGNLTIEGTGIIDVRGTDQITTGRTEGGVYGAGGASGGGAAIILYRGTLTNSGSILTGGGAGFSGGGVNAGPGGTGGAGSSIIQQIL